MSGYCPPYTQDEEKLIVTYIVDNGLISRIKGDKLWKDLEEANLVKRSWQSLKQHFRKVIIHQLHFARYGLTLEQQREFQATFNRINKKQSVPVARVPNRQVVQTERRRVVDLIDMTSSSDEEDKLPRRSGRNCTSPNPDTSDDDINFLP